MLIVVVLHPLRVEMKDVGRRSIERDKEIHERDLCQFRIAKCHDCREIKANQAKGEAEIAQVKEKQDEMKGSQDEMKASLDEIKSTQDEVKSIQGETGVKIQGMERKQDQIKVRQDSLFLLLCSLHYDQYIYIYTPEHNTLHRFSCYCIICGAFKRQSS